MVVVNAPLLRTRNKTSSLVGTDEKPDFALFCEQESFHHTDNHFLLSTQIDAFVHILYTRSTPTALSSIHPHPTQRIIHYYNSLS